MATRNPMNERYQGDGPGGQSRKSAASAKPVTKAAASVHVKQKPQTPSEKRAARKAREKEAEVKAKQKAAKAAAKEAAKEAEQAKTTGIVVEKAKQKPSEKTGGFLSSLKTPAEAAAAKTDEYKKWRRVYWILLGVGIALVLSSFLVTNTLGYDSPFLWAPIIASYVVIIAALVVDFRKVKPLVKKQKESSGKKTPKALKHEQEAKERAAAIEAARKASKEKKSLLGRKDKVAGEQGEREL